jgi:hypothetical protein
MQPPSSYGVPVPRPPPFPFLCRSLGPPARNRAPRPRRESLAALVGATSPGNAVDFDLLRPQGSENPAGPSIPA